jgi:mannose-6-phosphate isomerase-like protein (cupin superfamily)
MKKHEHLISRGDEQPLDAVAFHHQAPFSRYVMLQKDAVEGDGGFRVVTHVISDLPESIPPYCDLHQHEFDEINFILSEDGSLQYRIMLEDETYEVGPQTTVYIPKGTMHAAEVISGRGLFIAVMFTKNYTAKQ